MQQHANEIARVKARLESHRRSVAGQFNTICITSEVHDHITYTKAMENTLRLIQSTLAAMQAAQITPEVAQ